MTNDEILLKNFGLNIKIYRCKQKISQDTLAKQIGFSKSYISNVELGKHSISFVNATIIANALNKKLSDMIKEH